MKKIIIVFSCAFAMSIFLCSAQDAVNNVTISMTKKIHSLSEKATLEEGPIFKTGKFETKIFPPGEEIEFPTSDKSLGYSLALARKTFSFIPLNEESVYVLPSKGEEVPGFIFKKKWLSSKKKWFLKTFSKKQIIQKSEKTPIGVITNAG